MENIYICKYKNLEIDKLNIYDLCIKYNSLPFYIQSPVFSDCHITNYNNKKYLELKINETKISHIKFLTLIDSIEIKINKYNNSDENNISNGSNNIKTQIITDIQNKKSLKVKLTNGTSLYNSNKELVNNLYSGKISVLFKLEFYNFYYSWNAVQILQLN